MATLGGGAVCSTACALLILRHISDADVPMLGGARYSYDTGCHRFHTATPLIAHMPRAAAQLAATSATATLRHAAAITLADSVIFHNIEMLSRATPPHTIRH